jgi:hypothetical protein
LFARSRTSNVHNGPPMSTTLVTPEVRYRINVTDASFHEFLRVDEPRGIDGIPRENVARLIQVAAHQEPGDYSVASMTVSGQA